MQWECERCGSICQTSREFLPPCPKCGGATHPYSRGDQASRAVQHEVESIHSVVHTVLYPDELYERFLSHLTAALGASGAAIWRWPATQDAELVAHYGAAREWDPAWWESHRDLLSTAMRCSTTGEDLIAAGDSGNPTGLNLLIQKVHPRCPLAIVVAQGAAVSPAAIRGYAVFMKQMAELLSAAKCLPWE